MFLIYTRRSTDDAENQKNSLEYQLRLCREFAKQQKLEVTKDSIPSIMEHGVIAESHSAFKASALSVSGAGLVEYQIERPKFMQMISWLLEGKYEGVIVLCWDRISRNEQSDMIVKELIDKHNIPFKFVQADYSHGTSSGALHRDIDGMFARHHSRVTSEKVRNTFTKLRDDRQFPHRSPIGYLDEGPDRKVLDPERAPIVKRMFEIYAAGETSLSQLLKWAKEQGLTAKPRHRRRTRQEIMEGKEVTEIATAFHVSGLNDMLRNPFYIGSMRHGKGVIPGSHPPLIDMSTFLEVQERLSKNRQSVNYRAMEVFAFRGFVRCSCGRSYIPYRAKKNGEVYYQIKCLDGCENVNRNFSEKFAIDEACKIIDEIHFTDEERADISSGMKSGLRRAAIIRDTALEDVNRRRKKVLEDLDYLRENKITLLREGAMTAAELKKSGDELTEKLKELDAQTQAQTESEEEMLNYVLVFAELMKKAPSIFKRSTDIEKRKMVQLVFTELTIFDKKLISYKATEGMEWFLRRPVLSGGPGWN
ncbi:MAG: recombinase family protein [Candidatus Peregrinibacteria bacterium]